MLSLPMMIATHEGAVWASVPLLEASVAVTVVLACTFRGFHEHFVVFVVGHAWRERGAAWIGQCSTCDAYCNIVQVGKSTMRSHESDQGIWV